MEILRVADVVEQGVSIRTQKLRVSMGANSLTGVMEACARNLKDVKSTTSCVRSNTTLTMYSPPPSSVGCCGAEKVDHMMGSTRWLTCTPRIDGRHHVGLATSTDLDNLRCPFVTGKIDDMEEPDQCEQVVCDWTGVERVVAGDTQHYSTDASDSVVTDLFTGLDVFADPADLHPVTAQVVLFGMRPSACPSTAAGGMCNGVGYCDQGKCVCREGWGGEKCDAYDCGEGCQNGGTCTVAPNVCECPKSHTGPRCDEERSVEEYGCALPSTPSGPVEMECSGEGEPLTVCRYECGPGTAVQGNPRVTAVTRICAGEGRWNVDAPICTPVTCENIPNPKHSQVVCQGSALDDTCDVTCQDGYNVALVDSTAPLASTTVRCTYAKEGPPKWLPAIDLCTAVHCGPPMPPSGTTANSCKDDSFGDECNFECEHNSRPLGGLAMKSTCQANGKWSEVSARCVLDDSSEAEAPAMPTMNEAMNEASLDIASEPVPPVAGAPEPTEPTEGETPVSD